MRVEIGYSTWLMEDCMRYTLLASNNKKCIAFWENYTPILAVGDFMYLLWCDAYL